MCRCASSARAQGWTISGRLVDHARVTELRRRTAWRVSDLKRALRWIKAQYQRRAEEAASGQDRTIERIRKIKSEKDGSFAYPLRAARTHFAARAACPTREPAPPPGGALRAPGVPAFLAGGPSSCVGISLEIG